MSEQQFCILLLGVFLLIWEVGAGDWLQVALTVLIMVFGYTSK